MPDQNSTAPTKSKLHDKPRGFKLTPLSYRTSFFVELARDFRVPLAALAYFVWVCKSTEKSPRCWTTAQLGCQIGLKPWRIKYLLKEAEDAKLLGHARTTRGVRVWPLDKVLKVAKAAEVAKVKDMAINYYRLPTDQHSAFRLFGIRGYTASVLLDLMDPDPARHETPETLESMDDRTDWRTPEALEYAEEEAMRKAMKKTGGDYREALKEQARILSEPPRPTEQRTISVPKALKLFPWMTQRTANRALVKLAAAGVLQCCKPMMAVEQDHDFHPGIDPEYVPAPTGLVEDIFILKKSRWPVVPKRPVPKRPVPKRPVPKRPVPKRPVPTQTTAKPVTATPVIPPTPETKDLDKVQRLLHR